MKKILAFALVLALIMTSAFMLASCGKEEDEKFEIDESKLPEGTVIVDDVPPSGETPLAPGASYNYSRGSLTLAKDPVFEDGKLVLYFNESFEIEGEPDCYIGYHTMFRGDSIPATIDYESHPEMNVGDKVYNGIVLTPSEELSKGTYTISVTIGTYFVESFEYTVD